MKKCGNNGLTMAVPTPGLDTDEQTYLVVINTASMPRNTEMKYSFLKWYQAPTPEPELVSAQQCPTSCRMDCASVPTVAAYTDSTLSCV